MAVVMDFISVIDAVVELYKIYRRLLWLNGTPGCIIHSVMDVDAIVVDDCNRHRKLRVRTVKCPVTKQHWDLKPHHL